MDLGDEKKVKVLFLAANPNDTSRLRLGEEFKKIDTELQQSRYRDQFELVQMHAVSVGDLQELLLRFQPDIVHFSGHGSEDGALIFEHKSGFSEELPSEALSDLFSIVNKDNNIRCVVLDACYSESQAGTIGSYVDCVIGMSKAVTERAATLFSASFYRALGFGKNIKDAFDLGRNELKLQGIGEEQTPVMHHRPGINAEKILFVSPITHTTSTNPMKNRDGSIRKEILIALIAGPLATVLALAWPGVAAYISEWYEGNIVSPAFAEDCESFSPSSVDIEQIGQDWKIIDKQSSFVILDFKSNKDNAEHGAEVIRSYGFNRICFVGRPYNPVSSPVLPMMYFKINGTAPSDIAGDEGCKLINPQSIKAQKIGDNWLVLDGNINVYDFGSSQNSKSNAERAALVIKHYQFSKICFVDRPYQPMTYFLASEDNGSGIVGNAVGLNYYPHMANADLQLGKQITLASPLLYDCHESGCHPLDEPSTGSGPVNASTSTGSNATNSQPSDTTIPTVTIVTPTNGEKMNNPTPSISGLASDSSGIAVVVVSIDGQAFVHASTSNGWGSWNYHLISPLSSGSHSITARAYDNVGLISNPVGVYVTIDTIRPTLAVISPPDNAIIGTDIVTFSGTASDIGTGLQEVAIRIDNENWAPVTLDRNVLYPVLPGAVNPDDFAYWRYTFDNLVDGEHTVEVMAADNAGNEYFVSSEVTTDIGNPSIAVTSPQPGASLNDDSIIISGTASDLGSGILEVQYSIDNGESWADVSGTSSWSFVFSNSNDGAYNVNLRSIDKAGNISPTRTISFMIDRTSPSRPMINSLSEDAILNTRTFVVEGSAMDDGSGLQTVQYSLGLNNDSWTDAIGTSSWSFSLTLNDGSYILNVRSLDWAGNTSPLASLGFTVDTGQPQAPIIDFPSNNEILSNSKPAIGGSVSTDSASLEIYDGRNLIGTVTLSGSDSWSFIPPIALTEGTHTISAGAKDEAGNIVSSLNRVAITIDTIKPDVSITNPFDNTVLSANRFIVSGMASDMGTGVQNVEVQLDDGDFLPVNGIEDWELEVVIPFSSEAEHTLTARATDSAGNTYSSSVSITLEAQPDLPPTADAGSDLRVQEGSAVTLDGSGSRDDDGEIVLFTWTQTSGIPVNLENPHTVNPTFRLPTVTDTTEQLEFELEVTDSNGLTSSDIVNITIVPSSNDSGPFSISTNLDGTAYTVVGTDEGVILSSLTIEPEVSAVRLNVLAEEESNQIEISFPNEMISGIMTIMTDDGETVEFDASSDDTTSTIKFSVPPDTSFVEVIGTRVVPEFPFSVIALLAGLSIGLLLLRTKHNRSY